MKKKITTSVLVSCLLAVTATAMTMGEESFTCPLDGEEFKAYVNYSGYTIGIRLDLKPFGPTPAPWALPVCPKCRFPLFKKEFEKDEIERYKKLVHSKEFQSLPDDTPSYFLLAKVLEFDDAPNAEIAYAYLPSSWQVEEKPEKYKKCISLARAYYEKDYNDPDRKGEAKLTSGTLVAELSRQLGEFDKAIELVKLLQQEKIENDKIASALFQIMRYAEQSDSEPQLCF